MRGKVAQAGSIDLDALDNYLLSDHSPADCMGLSDLDGLLTAIVIGRFRQWAFRVLAKS
jgi:hypothetical protein